MQRISNSLFEAINKVTSGQALNEATDGEKTPVKKGEGHKPAWLLAAEIRAEKKEGKIKENMEMPEAPEPEDKIEAPSLNDKIKAMAMKKAAQTDNGNSVQALSARGPGADVKEEIENEDESFELSEATGNTEKRHLDSIIKMKDLEKASKKNTKMGRMADMLHTHAKDSFEDGDHKKIDKIHKFYHEMVDANKKDKSPESDILKGSKNVFKEETITEKEKWIADAIKKPGAETAAAKKAGMSVHAYAEKHKDNSGKAGKRARLALTLEKLPRHYGKRNEEIDEATGNTEKRHLDSIIKMKEVKKSKHDMAPSIHDHMEDALEKGNHKKIDQLHKVFKHMSEEVEQIDELSLQTMKSAKEKLGSKALDAHYNDDKRSARNYAGRALHMDAKIKRKERSASSLVKEEVEAFDSRMDEGITETIVKHNDFVIEVTDNPTYGDFLRAIRSISDPELVSEAEAISLASDAYDVRYDEIIIEDFTRSEIMDKHAAHRKAGNTVSHEKFGSRDGKPYAEYVVTDKEGGRKKYIHHGTTRRMESMSGKHKNAE